MKPDPAALDKLHDIVEPVPVSPWWPLAPGWWIAGLVIGVLAGFLLRRLIRSRKENAYRRQALRELAASEHPRHLPALLKRVALAAHPRAQAAGLSGKTWIAFLNREVPNCFDPATSELLLALDYEPPRTPARDEHRRLAAAIRKWIAQHPGRPRP